MNERKDLASFTYRAARLPLDDVASDHKLAGGGAVDNPASAPIFRQRDRDFAKSLTV